MLNVNVLVPVVLLLVQCTCSQEELWYSEGLTDEIEYCRSEMEEELASELAFNQMSDTDQGIAIHGIEWEYSTHQLDKARTEYLSRDLSNNKLNPELDVDDLPF